MKQGSAGDERGQESLQLATTQEVLAQGSLQPFLLQINLVMAAADSVLRRIGHRSRHKMVQR